VPELTIRPGYPDFLDLPWEASITEWEVPFVDLPKGISRHEVRFLEREGRLYAIKELPEAPARNDYTILRELEGHHVPSVTPVGLVTRRVEDAYAEASAALITEYATYSFALRNLVSGPGFGSRRNQMLDAFAGLLVELHLIGCFWGDCSLSNVLYRFDAETVMAIMVDAETASIHPRLSEGRREHDLEIMVMNVAGGMADIAASHGVDVDDADLALGEDIAERYRMLWAELTGVEQVPPEERWRITQRVERLNALGFEVAELEVGTDATGEHFLRLRPVVGSRGYHAARLAGLTGIDALEFQARQILADLNYHIAMSGIASREVAAIDYRIRVFEPWIARLRDTEGVVDPVQAFCDLIWFRYDLSVHEERPVSTEDAYDGWLAAGRPGFPLD
jgi:hypothetical protein